MGTVCSSCAATVSFVKQVKIPDTGDTALLDEHDAVRGVRLRRDVVELVNLMDGSCVCLDCYTKVTPDGSGTEAARGAQERTRVVKAVSKALAAAALKESLGRLPPGKEDTW